MPRIFGFRFSLAATAAILPLSLIAVLVFLIIYSAPAMPFNGLGFLVHNSWNLGNMYGTPVHEGGVLVLRGANYGILFLIVGTLFSAGLAMLIAVPLGVFGAMFLAEVLRGPFENAGSFLVEMLAAIPSVVYGLIGYIAVVPFLGHYVYPGLADSLGRVPGLSLLFGKPTYSGYGLLTTAVVLAFMVVPIIASMMRDALRQQPATLRESSLALGAGRFETLYKVLLPGLRPVVIGASILALGRALGETMAVLMVSGNALNYNPPNIYSPISTMASFIVSQLDSALQDPTGRAVQALTEIGLILFVLTLLVNLIARLLLWLSVRVR